MNIRFAKPIVPNFIHTEEGLFELNLLSAPEVQEYLDLYATALWDKWANKGGKR